MTAAPPTQFRTSALSHRKPTRFHLTPDAAQRAGIAAVLDLQKITFLELAGEIAPAGRNDFALTARLRADVMQRCVISLAPVRALVDDTIRRRYLADFAAPDGVEAEMPEDDSTDPLPEVIDLMEVLHEALALALPPYPRAPGAELGEAVFAEPGIAPLRDDDLRPFAALARLQGGAKDDAKDGTD